MNRLLVFTGNGKGKTTAALGMVLRATGHGMPVAVCQFVKSHLNTGEVRALSMFPLVRLAILACPSQPKPLSQPGYMDTNLHHRQGPLDLEGFLLLLVRESITLVVDVSHPFATQVQSTCRQAALQQGISYQRIDRPPAPWCPMPNMCAATKKPQPLPVPMPQPGGAVFYSPRDPKFSLPM